jgi:large subunit ribosomal protein L24
MKIKKGDMVKVIAGKDKGKSGRVVEVLRERDRVRVEGVAIHKKHLKAGRSQANPEGGIIDTTGTLHVSNVMIVDPASGKTTRIGTKLDGGKKVRVGRGKLAGAVLDAKT